MSRIIRGNQIDPRLSGESAFIKGKELGLVEGRAEALVLLQKAQRELTQQREQMLQLAASIAISVAAEIVGEVATRPEVAVSVAQKAHRAAGSTASTLTVHPQQKKQISEAFGDAFQVLTDDALQPGDCIIETQWGRLDARLSTQLEKYAEALREMVSATTNQEKDTKP